MTSFSMVSNIETVGEVPDTGWDHLASSLQGPFEVTVKENGCIIFVSCIEGNLAVASKHAMGTSPEKLTHAAKGEEWIHTHIRRKGASFSEFLKFLTDNNLTAVFEMADDDFEEHILSYPKEKAGLYLHGLNRNSIEFSSWPMNSVKEVAEKFGFYCVDYLMMNSICGKIDLKRYKAISTRMCQNRIIQGQID